MAFNRNVAPDALDNVGFSVQHSIVCCDGDWCDVVRGSFTLTYVRDTSG